MVELMSATSDHHLAQAKALFIEYAESLDFELCCQNFDKELETLPGDYQPPDGRLLLATDQGDTAGCVALRKIENRVCEMKRLYVRPSHRQRGIGNMLCDAVVKEARHAGYESMRLDTIPKMRAAIAMYESAGFRNIEPYCHNPIPGALYMELDLRERRE